MSKGHGSVQRKVLELLNEHELGTYLTVFDFAELLTPPEQPYLTPALIQSIRRAIKTLEAEGVVETRTISVVRDWTRGDYTKKRMLAARLPPLPVL